jgi:hypothetical protein
MKRTTYVAVQHHTSYSLAQLFEPNDTTMKKCARWPLDDRGRSNERKI